MTQAFSSTLSVWPRRKSFVSAVEARELIALTAPITGAALTNMGMSITDTVMMGWSGPEALAAGAVVSDLYSIVYYFMAGILSASAALMAQALGARRGAEVRRVLRQGFFAAAILTIPAFLLVWNTSSLLRMFGVEERVIELGNGYGQMMALTIVPMMFVAVWRNAFAVLGRPKIFLVATLLALPANGLANAVFMFGFGPIPAMGLPAPDWHRRSSPQGWPWASPHLLCSIPRCVSSACSGAACRSTNGTSRRSSASAYPSAFRALAKLVCISFPP